MSLFRFLSGKGNVSTGSVASAHTSSHGHDTHLAPWEGVNLWRTPYKGDADTITQVKRNKGFLDRYVENRTRHIQEMQLFALVKDFNDNI